MKRDFDQYYDSVANQYVEALEDLRDMEDALKDGLVSPEMYEQMKRDLQPLKTNYETLSYVMFLLNMPCKKDKQKVYVSQSKKILEHIKSQEEVTEENQKVLDSLKEYIEK